MNKTTKLLVMAGFTTAITFFGIKVYKTYKRVKVDLENEKVMSEVQEELNITQEILKENPERNDTFVNYERDAAPEVNTEEIDYRLYFETEEELDSEEEGEEKLRYAPSSPEALEQYHNMLLADVQQESTREIITKLFNVDFNPTCEEDKILYDRLVDDKMQFFGPSSCWIDNANIGDLFMHFANLTAFDLGETVNQWASAFVNNYMCGLSEPSTKDVYSGVQMLLNHTLYLNSAGEQGIFRVYMDPSEPSSFMKEYWKFTESYVGEV